MKCKELALQLKISVPTLRKRLRDPMSMNSYQIAQMADILGVKQNIIVGTNNT
jgi:hypothetical protein